MYLSGNYVVYSSFYLKLCIGRYPAVCLLVTSGALVFSVAMVVLAFLSRPEFDTGGADGHRRVKHL